MGDERAKRETRSDGPRAAFISYASPDLARAEEIARHLEQDGSRCWIAPRDVRPGGEYGDEIIRGIENSRCLVLVLSSAANASRFVRREVERAVAKGKPLLTFRIESVPPSLQLEFFVSSTQWIDAFGASWVEGLHRLAAALHGEPSEALISPPLPPPPATRRWPIQGRRRLPAVMTLLGLSLVAAAYAWYRSSSDPIPWLSRTLTQVTTGATSTSSGLLYKELTPGSGPHPTDTDVALIQYEGKLADGTVFDRSHQPTPMPVADVIPGFSEGLKLMAKGAKFRFWIKPELGYKNQRSGPIPPNSTLQFDVELLDFISQKQFDEDIQAKQVEDMQANMKTNGGSGNETAN